MEIYENFPINEFVDVIIHNSNDWGFHEESLYAVDLDTLKFQDKKSVSKYQSLCVRIQKTKLSEYIYEYIQISLDLARMEQSSKLK